MQSRTQVASRGLSMTSGRWMEAEPAVPRMGLFFGTRSRDELNLPSTHAVHHHDVAFPGVGGAHQRPSAVPRHGQAAQSRYPAHAKRKRSQTLRCAIVKPIQVDRVSVRSNREKDNPILSCRPEPESSSVENDRLRSSCSRDAHEPTRPARSTSSWRRAVQIEERLPICRLLRLHATVPRQASRLATIRGDLPHFSPARPE